MANTAEKTELENLYLLRLPRNSSFPTVFPLHPFLSLAFVPFSPYSSLINFIFFHIGFWSKRTLGVSEYIGPWLVFINKVLLATITFLHLHIV